LESNVLIPNFQVTTFDAIVESGTDVVRVWGKGPRHEVRNCGIAFAAGEDTHAEPGDVIAAAA